MLQPRTAMPVSQHTKTVALQERPRMHMALTKQPDTHRVCTGEESAVYMYRVISTLEDYTYLRYHVHEGWVKE
jgi:hypothetical protein